jgi:hypothetical protein
MIVRRLLWLGAAVDVILLGVFHDMFDLAAVDESPRRSGASPETPGRFNVLDAELAAHLGNAFEMCAMADLANVPPYPGFSALDLGITAGFLERAGFRTGVRERPA